MIIYDCTLKVKKLKGINQISKTVIQLTQKRGTMNRQIDGQLTICDERESTSIAVTGLDHIITLPRAVFC